MADSLAFTERHALAAETFKHFARGVDPEPMGTGFARRQGALGSMAFNVVGEMWSRPQLGWRDRSLLVIAVLAAQARQQLPASDAVTASLVTRRARRAHSATHLPNKPRRMPQPPSMLNLKAR